MKENMKELLMSYIKSNVAPILVDFIFGKDIPDAIILPADIKNEDLNGHYDKEEFVAPNWYNELVKDSNAKVLIIDLIDTIDKEEQLKFIELLEYRKISTFELPKNCVIIVTAKEINKNTINEEVYSLVAHIKG